MDEPQNVGSPPVPPRRRKYMVALLAAVALAFGVAVYAVGERGPAVDGPVSGPLKG